MLLQDVRYGFRMLWSRPGFSIVAIITLALGIGANTAIFSVVNAVLIRPLSFKSPERLVMVWEHNRPRAIERNVINPANFMDWQEQNSVLEEMAAFYDAPFNLTGVDDPEELPGQVVTTNYFHVLGVQPLMGREFAPDENQAGKDQVAILSYGLWQRRFGSNPAIIGQKVLLNGQPQTVVGVMPPDFNLFIKNSSFTGKKATIWQPLTVTENTRIRRGRFMSAIARLKPGVTLEQAQAEMDRIAANLEQQYPDFNKGWGIRLVPLQQQLVGEIRPALLVLLCAVGLVLLIACANVANLLLARAVTREKEIAIRSALGAARFRIIRQLLTESLLLALLGGVLGLLLAMWGVDLLVALSPPNLLPLGGTGVSLRILGFTLVVSLLTGIIFGLAPALQISRPDLNESLKTGGKGTAGGTARQRVRNTLVVVEVALALLLLTGSGLLIRSLVRLQSVNPGFDAANVLTARVLLPNSKYGEEHQRVAFFRELLERVERIPGVRSAGAISFLPLTGPGAATSFRIEGRPEPPPGEKLTLDVRVVDQNYFRTMSIPLLKGRNFNAREMNEAAHVVIINEALARKHFPGEDPIGKRLTINMKGPENAPSEIIGVVGDVKHAGLDIEPRGMSYWPHAELAYPFMTLVIRTETDPQGIASSVQREVRAMDKDQPLADVRTMETVLADSVARARFSTLLLSIFAGVALLLSAVGIYGVMAYSVSQRTHEIGIRMALGAQARDILRLVVRQGMLLVLLGVVIGLGASFALTRFMKSLLFGIEAHDPLTLLSVSLILAAIALLACLIPAHRATKVDPMIALHYE
ncbi:MAG TPA: ABC transporter permease [Pyrinomonadaceae bacterium]